MPKFRWCLYKGKNYYDPASQPSKGKRYYDAAKYIFKGNYLTTLPGRYHMNPASQNSNAKQTHELG